MNKARSDQEAEGTARSHDVSRGFVALLSKSAAIQERGLAESLDRALAPYELSGATLSLSMDDDGATLFEISTPRFRMFFRLGESDADSGWGLAFHRSSRAGTIANGPLEPATFPEIFRLILDEKRCFRTPASEASGSQVGWTLRA